MCLAVPHRLVMVAAEQSRVLSYYMPALGPAPRWCSFLDTITEELEESTSETVYEDYKFVTQREVEDLGISHLIGALRPFSAVSEHLHTAVGR